MQAQQQVPKQRCAKLLQAINIILVMLHGRRFNPFRIDRKYTVQLGHFSYLSYIMVSDWPHDARPKYADQYNCQLIKAYPQAMHNCSPFWVSAGLWTGIYQPTSLQSYNCGPQINQYDHYYVNNPLRMCLITLQLVTLVLALRVDREVNKKGLNDAYFCDPCFPYFSWTLYLAIDFVLLANCSYLQMFTRFCIVERTLFAGPYTMEEFYFCMVVVNLWCLVVVGMVYWLYRNDVYESKYGSILLAISIGLFAVFWGVGAGGRAFDSFLIKFLFLKMTIEMIVIIGLENDYQYIAFKRQSQFLKFDREIVTTSLICGVLPTFDDDLIQKVVQLSDLLDGDRKQSGVNYSNWLKERETNNGYFSLDQNEII